MQESGTAETAAKGVSVAQPCILVKGRLSSIRGTYLVVEKDVLCAIPPKEAITALMSTHQDAATCTLSLRECSLTCD
jgi:hypothetical protein